MMPSKMARLAPSASREIFGPVREVRLVMAVIMGTLIGQRLPRNYNRAKSGTGVFPWIRCIGLVSRKARRQCVSLRSPGALIREHGAREIEIRKGRIKRFSRPSGTIG